jgi:hypothetical protein
MFRLFSLAVFHAEPFFSLENTGCLPFPFLAADRAIPSAMTARWKKA